MNKKLVAMLLSMTMCAGMLVGCGNQEEQKVSSTETESKTAEATSTVVEEPQETVNIIVYNRANVQNSDKAVVDAMNKYGIRLRELRTQNGYTQVQLAKLLHISRSRLAMYEQGNRQPDFEMQETIADFFNVSIDYLFGRDQSDPYDEFEINWYDLVGDNQTPTQEEAKMIIKYRNSDDATRNMINRLLEYGTRINEIMKDKK